MIFREEVYPKVLTSSFRNSNNERGIIQSSIEESNNHSRNGVRYKFRREFKEIKRYR